MRWPSETKTWRLGRVASWSMSGVWKQRPPPTTRCADSASHGKPTHGGSWPSRNVGGAVPPGVPLSARTVPAWRPAAIHCVPVRPAGPHDTRNGPMEGGEVGRAGVRRQRDVIVAVAPADNPHFTDVLHEFFSVELADGTPRQATISVRHGTRAKAGFAGAVREGWAAHRLAGSVWAKAKLCFRVQHRNKVQATRLRSGLRNRSIRYMRGGEECPSWVPA